MVHKEGGVLAMPRNDTVPPVNILVVNAGSSSLKFMMFCMTKEQMLAKGIVERIGLKEPNLVYQRFDGQELREQVDVHNHDDALKVVCEKLVDRKYGVLDRLTEVEAIEKSAHVVANPTSPR